MHWHILRVEIDPERFRQPECGTTRYPDQITARNALIDDLRRQLHEHGDTGVTFGLAQLVTDPDPTHVGIGDAVVGTFSCDGDSQSDCEQVAYDHWSVILAGIEQELMDDPER